MRQLMEEGHIHDDVVSKLWQVYSTCRCRFLVSLISSDSPVGSQKSLDRFQRRGAIIILAMLAVAKREVVADRVETLVRIGLGHKGKVSYRRFFYQPKLTGNPRPTWRSRDTRVSRCNV